MSLVFITSIVCDQYTLGKRVFTIANELLWARSAYAPPWKQPACSLISLNRHDTTLFGITTIVSSFDWVISSAFIELLYIIIAELWWKRWDDTFGLQLVVVIIVQTCVCVLCRRGFQHRARSGVKTYVTQYNKRYILSTFRENWENWDFCII